MFSPADAEESRRAVLSKERKTPITYGNRPGTNKKVKPKRKPGDHYDVAAYRRAITRACDRAFPIPEHLRPANDDDPKQSQEKASKQTLWHNEHHWHPHQLRHNAATRIRREYGIEAAQVILGHSTLRMTELYAEKDIEQAVTVMKQVG